MKMLKILFLCIWMTSNAYGSSKVHYVLSSEPIDVVIPCATKDVNTLDFCIRSIRQHVKNVRRIIVVSAKPLTNLAEWFDEKNYPFSKKEIALEIFDQNSAQANEFINHPQTRIGWIYQQFLKLYAPFVIPEISPNTLVVDADVIWLNPTEFMSEHGEPFFTAAYEYAAPYFEHISRLFKGLKRFYPQYSGIAHHMLFQKPILEDLFQEIRLQHNEEPWKAICRCIDHREVYYSSFSEYEIYFNFVFHRTDQAHLRFLRWTNCNSLNDIKKYQKHSYAYVACHAWSRSE